MKTALFLAALTAFGGVAHAQTVVNNNNTVIVNNGGNGNANNGFGDGDTGQAVYWRNQQRNLEAWLYTDRTNYRPGTGVQMRVTLTNLFNGSASYQLPKRGEYTIAITDTRTNRVIWSRDRAQNRGGTLQLNAGGTAQWVEFWDQRDAAGNVVPMGAYRIDVRVLDTLPVSAQVFLSDKATGRPQPGGGIITPDPVGGIGAGNGSVIPQADSLRASLTLNKTTVRPGEVVRYTYTIANALREPLAIRFSTSQTHDVWATTLTRTPTSSRTPAWRLSDGMIWAQVVQNMTLQPGERRTYTGTWRIGRELSGQTLDVSASLTPFGASGNVVGGAATRLTVQ